MPEQVRWPGQPGFGPAAKLSRETPL